MIRKVIIRNYRKFCNLDVDMLPGTNILVGSNDSGKSTLIEAINLALTGRLNGRLFEQALSPYYITLGATREYVRPRSDERRVGHECVRKLRNRRSREQETTNK